jgi:hypothetical protein
MPYVLNSGSSCGENSVNSDFSNGRLDGFTIVMGHEIEETVTDPGAEDVIDGVNLGGWYDYSAYENGDKCAWVGYLEGITPPSTVPGGLEQHHGQRREALPRAEPLVERLRRRRGLLRRRGRRPARRLSGLLSTSQVRGTVPRTWPLRTGVRAGAAPRRQRAGRRRAGEQLRGGPTRS